MRAGWKRLAERAWNAAFNDTERNEALAQALHGDWSVEVSERLVGRLRGVLDDAQGDLFDELSIGRLEGLRGEIRGGPLEGMLLDCSIQEVHRGYRGDEALERAAGDALRQRAESGRRQVEEHRLRTSPAQSVERVRSGIDGAIVGLDMNSVARRCIGFDSGKASRASFKKTGIDDGVSLS